MSEQSLKNYKNWLLQFTTIDSTNNYAMQLISDGLAEHGQVVWTKHQSKGKGQRGKFWIDRPGESLLMSIILTQFNDNFTLIDLNMLVALVIQETIQSLLPNASVKIKWPNDIYIHDKKTCGILIENGFKGSTWSHAVIGIGINIYQKHFDETLQKATSLYLHDAKEYNMLSMIDTIRTGILNKLSNVQDLKSSYLARLYKINEPIQFKNLINQHIESGIVRGIDEHGNIRLEQDEKIVPFSNGSIEWIY